MPRKLRVLVVEDYTDTRESLTRLLDIWGHVVDTAADGEKGLQLASSGSYDAIILDLKLPNLSGVEVGRQIAQKTPHPVLIAYSAWHREEDRERTFSAGFDAHLPKSSPDSTDQLGKILEHLRSHLSE